MGILLFFIGCIFGSFYLVVGTRLPKGENIIFSRSRCDTCKKELKWYNLIPLFSFLFQKGKCTYCKNKISLDHFFVELVTGFLFLLTYYYFPLGYNFFIALIVISLLVIIFVSDFKYMIILDSPLIISGILIIILKLIYFGFQKTMFSILSGLGLFLIMLFVQMFGNKVFKKESLGGGDIKLAFIIGLILDFQLGLVSLILSTFLALPYAVAVYYLNKNSEFPFGPFLVGALFIVFYHYDKFNLLFEFLFPF